jgi:AraC-like DNA-binding protein
MLAAEETPVKQFLLNALLGKENQGYLHFKVADVMPIQNLVENLLWSLLGRAPNQRNINQTTMGLLIMQLLNHTDRLTYQSREEAAILRIYKYIEENYRDGSLTDASRLLHYDFYWLSHEIKNQTGKTYTELVQEKRLSQAAYLLRGTKLSVEEISGSVGYENKSYFHRIFSRQYGTSPKKYRDQSHGAGEN